MLPGKECALSAYVQTDKIKAQGVKKTNDPDKDRPISWLDEERFLAEKKMQGKKKVKGVNDYYYNPYSLPVTGISYEQAGEYAKWCTSKLNNDLNRRQKEDISKVFWFRLPTSAEQEKMLMEGVEKCTDKNPNSCAKKSVHLKSCKNDKGCALCNVAEKDTFSSNKMIIEAFGKDALYSVWAFNPNWLGLYNLMGNAAEMSAEKGIAKGGSYLQKADDCQPSSHLNYEGPQSWLGFRLVAEIRDVDAGGIWINNDGMIMFTDEQN